MRSKITIDKVLCSTAQSQASSQVCTLETVKLRLQLQFRDTINSFTLNRAGKKGLERLRLYNEQAGFNCVRISLSTGMIKSFISFHFIMSQIQRTKLTKKYFEKLKFLVESSYWTEDFILFYKDAYLHKQWLKIVLISSL